MKLTHARDHGLASLLVGFHGERGILLRQLGQSGRELIQIFLGLGLYGNTNHRIGEVNCFQDDRLVLVAQRVAGTDIFESYTGANVSRSDKIFRILLVGVHLEETGNTLLLSRAWVVHVRSGLNLTRVYAEETQTSHIGIGSNLERKCTHGFVWIGMTQQHLLRVTGVGTGNRFRIRRTRQVSTHSIEQCLYSLVFERRSTDHRIDLHRQRPFSDCSSDLLLGNCIGSIEELFHQRIITFGKDLEHLLAPLIGFVLQVSGNIHHVVVGTHCLVVPVERLHRYQINHSLEVLFRPDRYLNGTRCSAQHLLYLAYHIKEVCSRAVHLIHIADTGHFVLVGLTPNGLRLRLHTSNGTKRGHGAIKHTQRTLYLHREIHVSRGVDQIYLVCLVVIFPARSGGSRGDGDPPFLLLLHPVHGGRTVVHLANLVRESRIKQDTLRCGGLAGVNMRHDT